MNSDIRQFIRMSELAIEDRDGKLYFPVYGYNQEVVAYAPGEEALDLYENSLED